MTSDSTNNLEGYEGPIHDSHATFQINNALVQAAHATIEFAQVGDSDATNGSDSQQNSSLTYETTVEPINFVTDQDFVLPRNFYLNLPFPSPLELANNSQLHHDIPQVVPLSASGLAMPAAQESNYICHRCSQADITASRHTDWPLVFELFGLDSFLGRIAKSLSPYLETALEIFYRRAAAVHFRELQHDSSIYLAAETFVCQYAGSSHVISVFAILREVLELTPCLPSRSGELAMARNDLVFDFAVVGPAMSSTSFNPWLHEQSIVTHFSSSRMRAAIWKLSRLPLGPHLPDSASFRWLRRSFQTLATCIGPQTTVVVQSGSEKYQFRRFHQALADLKYLSNPLRAIVLSSSATDDACVRTVQEWFIAVLDEVVTRSGLERQLQFLEAHKSYMLASLDVFVRAFENIGLTECLHICSLNCSSHVQPSFRSLLDRARDSLDQLFSNPQDLLRSIQRSTLDYPTQQQLFHARVIGLSLCKFYVSNLLLPQEKEIQHHEFTRATSLSTRRDLVENYQSNLIWNYLPLEVAQRATVRLDRALAKFGPSQAVFVM